MQSEPSLVTPMVLDVSDWKATEKLLPPAIADKRVHYLVNNVANIVREPFGQISEANMDKCAFLVLNPSDTHTSITTAILIRFLCRHYNEILKATINVTQVCNCKSTNFITCS